MRPACKPGSAVITSDNRRGWARLTRPAAAVLRARTSSSISLPFPLQLFRIPAPAAGGPFFVFPPPADSGACAHRLETRSATYVCRVLVKRPRRPRVFFVQ